MLVAIVAASFAFYVDVKIDWVCLCKHQECACVRGWIHLESVQTYVVINKKFRDLAVSLGNMNIKCAVEFLRLQRLQGLPGFLGLLCFFQGTLRGI